MALSPPEPKLLPVPITEPNDVEWLACPDTPLSRPGPKSLNLRTHIPATLPPQSWARRGFTLPVRAHVVLAHQFRNGVPRRAAEYGGLPVVVPRVVVTEVDVTLERGNTYFHYSVEAISYGPWWVASPYDALVEPIVTEGCLTSLGALADRLEEDEDRKAVVVRLLQQRCREEHPASAPAIARRDIVTIFGGSHGA